MKGKLLLQEEEAKVVEQESPSNRLGVTVPGTEGHRGLGRVICHCIPALQRGMASLLVPFSFPWL